MIQVRKLTRRYGTFTALQDVSFDAPDGAITGVLGANGAGKTTLLRILAGILRPDSGGVRIGTADQRPGKPSPDTGALLDDHGLYPRLTAFEHLVYFGRLRGLSTDVLRARVDETLALLGLEGVSRRPTGGFSQGERCKVALGCALIHEPSHLLLDEPTNGLDVPTVRALRALLRHLRDTGRCILLSSHVMREVEEVCDRVVIVARGRLVAEGTVESICARASTATLEDAFVELTGTEASPCASH